MAAFDSRIAVFSALAIFAGRPEASLFLCSDHTRRDCGRISAPLQALYVEGVQAMESGRWLDAERRFLSILLSAPDDWDVQERLAVLYQRENRLEERDIQLENLRGMLAKGTAWRDYIWRDQFVHKGWRVMAVERPAKSSGQIRKYLFAVSDAYDGRFIRLVIVTHRPVETGTGAGVDRDSAGTFESEAQSGNRRKVYRLPAREPRYSDSVRILERFLEGI